MLSAGQMRHNGVWQEFNSSLTCLSQNACVRMHCLREVEHRMKSISEIFTIRQSR